MKLSIVIALYNTEQYIGRCIQSVLDSDLLTVDYEIIVVNDGSTDDGTQIVNEFQKIHSNIKLINKINGGQSSARNCGFENAVGEYVFCLDSDDFIESSLLKSTIDILFTYDLDMYPIKFIKIDDSNNMTLVSDGYPIINHPITGKEFLNKFVISGAMGKYFFRTSILKENSLQLIEGIFHEDEEFVTRFLTYVNRICYHGVPLYYYYVRSNSTMNNRSPKHRMKLICDLIVVAESLNEVYNKQNEYFGVKRKVQQVYLSVYLNLLNLNGERSFKLDVLKRLKKNKGFPLRTSELSKKQKLACLIFNNFSSILFWK